MGIKDDINRILRDHEGYTGDGRGGVGELPIGDRSTARKPISKRDLREVLGAVHDSVADPAAAAIRAAEDAEDAADRAELAAAGVEYPVSYALQTLTAPQQAQTRANIGAAALSRVVSAGTGLTGGGDLSADRTLAADFATAAEALAGVVTNKVMSPARVRQAAGAVTRGSIFLDLAGAEGGSLSNLGDDLYEIKLSVSNVVQAASHVFFRARVTGNALLTSGYTVLDAGGTGLEVTGSTGEWLRIPVNSTIGYRVTRKGRTRYWDVEVLVGGKVGRALINTGAAVTRVTGVNFSTSAGFIFTACELYGRTEDFS